MNFSVKNLCTFNKTGINLNNLNFSLNSEVHALVGERGAGKKVLVDVLAGWNKKFSGNIYFNGNLINKRLSSRNNSLIMFLLNEPFLANNLSVAENIFLMKNTKRIFEFVKKSTINYLCKQLFDDLNLEINPKEYVKNLTMEEKRMVEVAKIYYYNPEMIIMYEPTVYLSSKSKGILYDFIMNMKDNGKSILYLTSLWEEVLPVSDRISVIYDGNMVGTIESVEARKNPERLIRLILGWDSKEDIKNKENMANEEVVRAMFKASEYLTSNYEIKDVIEVLESTSCKIMDAEGCYVYLLNEESQRIIDIIKYRTRDDVEAELNNETVFNIMKKNDFFYSNSEETNFEGYFSRSDKTKTIICYPVLIRSHYTALIEVFYDELYKQTSEQSMYLSALSRQAAVAIDNTRLMGRSALLQESHHRIKNNLQTIISIIKMQQHQIKNSPQVSTKQIIEDVISRIKSIAAVHDLLSKSEVGGSIINLKLLIKEIIDIYVHREKPQMDLHLDDIFIPYNKATTIGLIINELINNCMKHAFESFCDALIKIDCEELKDNVSIKIEDNGRGISEDFYSGNTNKLGLPLVNSIVKNEFHGTLKIIRNEGTVVNILIPKEALSISDDL